MSSDGMTHLSFSFRFECRMLRAMLNNAGKMSFSTTVFTAVQCCRVCIFLIRVSSDSIPDFYIGLGWADNSQMSDIKASRESEEIRTSIFHDYETSWTFPTTNWAIYSSACSSMSPGWQINCWLRRSSVRKSGLTIRLTQKNPLVE